MVPRIDPSYIQTVGLARSNDVVAFLQRFVNAEAILDLTGRGAFRARNVSMLAEDYDFGDTAGRLIATSRQKDKLSTVIPGPVLKGQSGCGSLVLRAHGSVPTPRGRASYLTRGRVISIDGTQAKQEIV